MAENQASAAHAAIQKRKHTRQERALDLRAQGYTQQQIADDIGISYNGVEKWKIKDPDFKRRWRRVSDKVKTRAYTQRPFDASFRQEYFDLDTPSHLQSAMDLINNLGAWEWGCILFPPNFAKTSTIEDFICHQVAMDPNVRILVVSKTQKHAIKILGRIKERMSNRHMFGDYLDDYGPFKSDGNDGRPWTSTHVMVARQDSNERDYTIEAVGIAGQVYGTRSDIIVLDDVADTDNQTASQIDEQLEWLQLIVDSRLDPDHGKGIVVGTRIREDDIYGRLEELGFFHKILKMPAIIREPGQDSPEDPGESLWPKRWPMEKLLRKRARTDPRIWELSYQQNPIPSEGAIFPFDAITSCYDESRFLQDVPARTQVVVGIDPSVVNYAAAVCLAVDPHTKIRHLVDVWNEKNLTGDGGDIHAGLIEFIVNMCATHNAKVCCIERNSVFALLTDSLTLRSKLHDLGVRIVTYQSAGTTEDVRIAALSGLFTNRMITLPTAGWSKGRIKPFVDQLVRWRPGDKKQPKDMIKALQMAEHGAKHVLTASMTPQFMGDNKKMPPYLRKQQKWRPLDGYGN